MESNNKKPKNWTVLITIIVIIVMLIAIVVAVVKVLANVEIKNDKESKYNSYVEGQEAPDEVIGEIKIRGFEELPEDVKEKIRLEMDDWSQWERDVTVTEADMSELDFVASVAGVEAVEEVEVKVNELGAPKGVYVIYGESEYDTMRYTLFLWEEESLLLYTGP